MPWIMRCYHSFNYPSHTERTLYRKTRLNKLLRRCTSIKTNKLSKKKKRTVNKKKHERNWIHFIMRWLEMWISFSKIIIFVNTTNYFVEIKRANERAHTKCLGVSIELLKCWQQQEIFYVTIFRYCTRLNAIFLIEISNVPHVTSNIWPISPQINH